MSNGSLIVGLPYQLNPQELVGFFQRLAKSEVDPRELVLDFSPLGFVEPFATMVLAHGLRQLLAVREGLKLNTRVEGLDGKIGAISYLKHLGFFQFIGLKSGKRTDEARPIGERFLPLTTIRRGQIENKGRVMQATLDLQAERLSRIVFPGDEGVGPAMMLAYSLREIMRNAFEHGRVDECMALAQRWSDGTAEIAIADQGIGIPNSLGPILKEPAPEKVLASSLLPGISSQSVKDDSEWENTGFGLYVVSELGKRYGSFALLSAKHMLYYENGAQKISNVEVWGTMVKLRVNTADAEFFPNILQMIVGEGEKAAHALEGAVKSASKMSKQPVHFTG